MHVSIKITLEEIVATVKKNKDIITFPSGLECVFDKEGCFDAFEGFYSWTKQSWECLSNGYDVLYEGSANVTSDKSGKEVLSIANNEFILASKIGFSVRVCNSIGRHTSIEGLFIVFQINNQFQIQHSDFHVKKFRFYKIYKF